MVQMDKAGKGLKRTLFGEQAQRRGKEDKKCAMNYAKCVIEDCSQSDRGCAACGSIAKAVLRGASHTAELLGDLLLHTCFWILEKVKTERQLSSLLASLDSCSSPQRSR